MSVMVYSDEHGVWATRGDLDVTSVDCMVVRCPSVVEAKVGKPKLKLADFSRDGIFFLVSGLRLGQVKKLYACLRLRLHWEGVHTLMDRHDLDVDHLLVEKIIERKVNCARWDVRMDALSILKGANGKGNRLSRLADCLDLDKVDRYLLTKVNQEVVVGRLIHALVS